MVLFVVSGGGLLVSWGAVALNGVLLSLLRALALNGAFLAAYDFWGLWVLSGL